MKELSTLAASTLRRMDSQRSAFEKQDRRTSTYHLPVLKKNYQAAFGACILADNIHESLKKLW